MSAEALIDTNVFLYHVDDSDPEKHEIATRIVRSALQTAQACISHQVVQEFLNVVMRKAAIPLDPEAASNYMRDILVPLWRVMPTPTMYQRAIAVQARYGFHFYDSLIVAAALEGGCTRLLTEDLQHGQRIETLTVENPFL